jgi:hypothetical protein
MDVPAATPVTTPELLTVATLGVAVDQLPPPVALLRVVVIAVDRVVLPVIALTIGAAFTVNIAVTVLPLTVYDIVVVPATKPATIPVLPTVATVMLLLLQLPPDAVLLTVVLEPTHTLSVPVIGGILATKGCMNPCVSI